MPDDRDLPEYSDDLPLDEDDTARRDDDDVPFRLPHVDDFAAQPTLDARDDQHQMVTMPVFREPGVPDPKATLPGSGGLDPNPDFVVHEDPASARTVRHPAVRLTESPPPPQATMPNPDLADDRRYQRPPYAIPPAPQAANAPPVPKLPPRRRKRGLAAFRPGCLWVFIGLFVTFCGGLTLVTMATAAIFIPRIEAQWTERIAAVDDYRSFQTTFIYDRYGNLLYEAFTEGRREKVPYARFPKALIQATISIEDDTYFSNIGVDVPATMVAFLRYVGAPPNEQTSGGSTITQQVVRNVLFPYEKRIERSIQRKAEEIILALFLTANKSKEDILAMYLNEIYYGNLAYGAQAAAQTFFGKDVEDLTLGEAALLAGLPQAPAELDPLNPDPAVQTAVYDRWREVLDEMVEEGYISATERDLTLSQGLNFASPNVSLKAPHFTVYAQRELERLMTRLGYSAEDVARGGYKVYTTIDQRINTMAQQAAAEQVARLAANRVSNAAVFVMKPTTGEILAMVGSIDYNNDAIDGRVNVTTAFRQPGSTMKIFTYSAAMERGMSAGDVIWDTPTEIGIPGQPMYVPRNYDGAFHGPMRMRYALANSYNIPAVQTLRLAGVDYLLEFMRRLGVESLGADASRYGLSLTLGGGEITLVELTNAYAVYPNGGSYVPVTSILCVVNSESGDIIYQYENGCPEGRITPQSTVRLALGKQVLDPRIAFLMTDILADNNARSAAMGSNSPLRTDGIATSVKTGTTNDVKDNWTVGYTRNVAVGVWVGNNNGDPMVNSSGLTGAAPIWNRVITTIYNDPQMMQSLLVNGQLLPDGASPPSGMTLRRLCDVRRLTNGSTSCPAYINEWLFDYPAGIPDAEGNLYYPQPAQAVQGPSGSGSYVVEVDPGVYRTLAFPVPPSIASAIQFPVGVGEKVPPPPQYCRVPAELAGIAAGAQELLFIGLPSTSQADSVEAERYAQNNNLATLPRIDCWADIFNAQIVSPGVVTAFISSPANGEVVTGNVPIIGTAQFSRDIVNFYIIEIQGPDFPSWTPLGEIHFDSVVNGQLEYLYAAGLTPGTYQLRLGLIDHNSNFLQTPYVVTFQKQ